MERTKSQIIAEIEQCKKRIEELDKIAQDMKDDELKIWEPKSGERYLYIRSDGVTSISHSDSFSIDENRSKLHNVFPESSRQACKYYSYKRICVDGIFAIEYPYGSYDYRYRANFKWKNVGKTIFYTREEAENALKERIEHSD